MFPNMDSIKASLQQLSQPAPPPVVPPALVPPVPCDTDPVGVGSVALEAATSLRPVESLQQIILKKDQQYLVPTIYEGDRTPTGRSILIFFCGPIGASPRYLNAVEQVEALLPTLQETDEVTFYLSGPGGYVTTATRVTSAMDTCRAHLKTVAYGQIASATSLIWSHGDECIIAPGQGVMIHMSSHADSGNSWKIRNKAGSLKDYVTRIALQPLHEKGVLDDDQMARIAEYGEDVYIPYDHVVLTEHSKTLNSVPDDITGVGDLPDMEPPPKEDAPPAEGADDKAPPADKASDDKTSGDDALKKPMAPPPAKSGAADAKEATSPSKPSDKQEPKPANPGKVDIRAAGEKPSPAPDVDKELEDADQEQGKVDKKVKEDEDKRAEKAAKAHVPGVGLEAFMPDPIQMKPSEFPSFFPNIMKNTVTGNFEVCIQSGTYGIGTKTNVLAGIEQFLLTRSEGETVVLSAAYLAGNPTGTGCPSSLISAMKLSKAKVIVKVDTLHDDAFAYVVACGDHHLITRFGGIQLDGLGTGNDMMRHGDFFIKSMDWVYSQARLLTDEDRAALKRGQFIMVDGPELLARSQQSAPEPAKV